MNKPTLQRSFVLLAVFIAAGFIGASTHQSQSASLTQVSVTLSNPRISFRGQVAASNTTGTSQLEIETSTNPSNTTEGMVEGDILSVGVAASQSFLNYEVQDLPADDTFALKSALTGLSHTSNFDVIASQSANLTVRFNTASAVNNGSIRVLIPAISSDTDSSDGVPDQNGWDLNDITDANVTCPVGVSGYSFGTPVVTASVTVGGADYHSILCPYSGTGTVGANFQTGDDVMLIEGLINPAPVSGHTTGNADTYPILVQNTESDDVTVVDSTTVRVGVIEAVRITASVAPQLTFTITGTTAGSFCGLTTDVNTEAHLVPLGELEISNFTSAAQNLLVSTNASNGYVVTALAADQLGKDGQDCASDPTADPDCIPDSLGDGGTMGYDLTLTEWDDWTNTTTKGFAYTIDNDNAASVPFEYSSVTGGCTNTGGTNDCYAQFADNEATQDPQTIFSSTTVADAENIDLCYKAIISATQAAGNYETYVNYTATATF